MYRAVYNSILTIKTPSTTTETLQHRIVAQIPTQQQLKRIVQ